MLSGEPGSSLGHGDEGSTGRLEAHVLHMFAIVFWGLARGLGAGGWAGVRNYVVKCKVKPHFKSSHL